MTNGVQTLGDIFASKGDYLFSLYSLRKIKQHVACPPRCKIFCLNETELKDFRLLVCLLLFAMYVYVTGQAGKKQKKTEV